MINQGKSLRTAIKVKGLSVQEAADKVGLDRGTLYNYFKKEQLDKAKLLLFQDKLNIKIQQSLNNSDSSALMNFEEEGHQYIFLADLKKEIQMLKTMVADKTEIIALLRKQLADCEKKNDT